MMTPEAITRLREERTLDAWLADPASAAALAARARGAILASKGATERTVRVLEPRLAALRAAARPGVA